MKNFSMTCIRLATRLPILLLLALAGTAQAVTPGPQISITSPANNSTFIHPSTIPVTATWTTWDNAAMNVVFYVDGTQRFSTGQTAASSYTWNWNFSSWPTSQTYALTAYILDDQNKTKTSTTVYVTIRNAANAPPTVTLTSPTSGASSPTPGTFTLTATASDSDGYVSKVDYYSGSTLINTAYGAPYAYTLTGLAAGNYAFKAVATDDIGATTTTPVVNVTVTAAPTVFVAVRTCTTRISGYARRSIRSPDRRS